MEEQVYYLSGPMTGIEDHNFPLFADVAGKLRADGFQIRSPHELQDPADQGDQHPYEWYIRKDVQIMMECNAIILLPGWMRSKGSRIELNLALDLNFDVYRVFSFTSHVNDSPDRQNVQLRIAPIDEGLYEYDRY